MNTYKFLALSLVFASSQAFAWGAYTGKLVCVTPKTSKIGVSVIMPFSNAQADGFEFDVGQMNVKGASQDAKLINRNNKDTLGIGPSMFTLQGEYGNKLGFITKSKQDTGTTVPVTLYGPETRIEVEVFNEDGKSLGVEDINCDIIVDSQIQ